VTVRQVVGDERPEDADDDDGRPVHDRHVAAQAELDEQENGQQGACDVGRLREAEAEVILIVIFNQILKN
jgi:hypothetical protein